MCRKNYHFPMPGDIRNVRKRWFLIFPGLMIQTGWSLREVISFYRQEFAKQGLKEEKFFETETENFANLVFSGLPRRRAIIVNVIEVSDLNLRVITIDMKDARRYTTPVEYKEFFNDLDKGQGMYNNWLQRELTIEEAEARHMVYDSRLGNDEVPFGFMNKEWKALITRMVDGDKLWEFNSPEDTWQNLCGRAGIALVRNGEVIDIMITKMN